MMQSKQVSKEAEEIIELIEERGSPKRMSKENWRDFLSQLIDEMQSRFDAVEEELGE
jgi:hypothetical protein